jgi:hypothetical protein
MLRITLKRAACNRPKCRISGCVCDRVCSLPNIVRGGKIKKNEMDWAGGAYGGGERCAQGVGGEA